MEKEVVDAALILVKKHSKVKAIVLECTNMPPFTSRCGAGDRIEGMGCADPWQMALRGGITQEL